MDTAGAGCRARGCTARQRGRQPAASQREQHPAGGRERSQHAGEATDGRGQIQCDRQPRRYVAQRQIIERRLGVAQAP